MTERPAQTPITSPRSERVRRIAALAGRSARRKQGLFRVEGPQAVRSLLTARPELAQQLHITAKAAADHPELLALAQEHRLRVQEVPEQIIRAMVRDGGADGDIDLEHRSVPSPQGAVAVAQLPAEDYRDSGRSLAQLPPTGPITVVVLHEVRDPGNVGTLIRTADAAGAELVVLTRTCADPYAPKALRAATGSTFHVPVVTGAEAPELLASLAQASIASAATSGYAELDLFEAELPERIAWILGNEARGLDAATLEAASLSVRIPLAGQAESLNVHTAATVCLFETLRRRRSTS